MLLGADIVAGEKAPIQSLVESISLAASVLINAQHKSKVAIPNSTTITSAKGVSAVINAGSEELQALSAKGAVYGAAGNVFSLDGVSALWNGFIGNSSIAAAAGPFYLSDVPSVVVDGAAVHLVEPANMIAPVTNVYFFDKQAAANSTLEAEEGFRRIAAAVDSEAKAADIRDVFKSAKFLVINSISGVN